jgi:hypothetical protein
MQIQALDQLARRVRELLVSRSSVEYLHLLFALIVKYAMNHTLSDERHTECVHFVKDEQNDLFLGEQPVDTLRPIFLNN